MDIILREPLLDPQEKVVGFQFSWQSPKGDVQDEVSMNRLEELVTFVARQLNSDDGYLMPGAIVYLEATPALIRADALTRLSASNTVLIFSKRFFGDEKSLADIQELRDLGFGIALRNADESAMQYGFFKLLTHFCLSWDVTRLSQNAKTVAALKNTSVKIIAHHVNTWQDFEACSKLGLFSFVGKLHLTPRPNAVKKDLNTTQTTLLQLMEMVRKNTDINVLEGVFKRDPALSYKILNYINSPAFGLRVQVQSLKHAVTMLGYSPLYRWLTVLLANASRQGNSPVLLETAILRGRFAELLAQSNLSKTDAENAFVAGMFSLIDRILVMPMDEVLKTVQLPVNVIEALHSRGGVLGPYVAVAEACELNINLVESLANTVKLTNDDVNKAHLSALVWAKNIVNV